MTLLNRDNLLTVIPAPDKRLCEAVRHCVVVKDRWDDALHVPGLRELVPTALTNVDASAVGGMGFARMILPFLNTHAVTVQSALVPLDRTLGTPWSWRDGDRGSRFSPDTLERMLLDPARAVPGDKEEAELVYVEAIGLYIAHEGKNRVRFLRDRGVEHFPACVTFVKYPEPSSLVLYRVDLFGEERVWVVLDERYVRPVPVPSLSCLLFSAYGVRGPEQWPRGWPAVCAVASVFDENHAQLRHAGQVDLDVLREMDRQAVVAEEWIRASIPEMVDVTLNLRWWAKWSAIWLVGALATRLLPPGPDDIVLTGLLGVSVGLLAAWGCKGFLVRRKMLERYRRPS